MPTNKNAPHQAVILLRYEIHERLPNGQASGKVTKSGSKTFEVTGKNFLECKSNLINFLKKSDQLEKVII